MAQYQIKEIIENIIQEWEQAFPKRVLGWYLLGSHSNGFAVSGSDLDLFFVLNDQIETESDISTASKVEQKLKTCYPMPIEVWGQSLNYLQSLETRKLPCHELIHTVSIKLGSKHLKGIDIREEIPLPPIKLYSNALASIACGWIMETQNNRDCGSYLGYCKTDTKPLVRIVLSVASALIADKVKIYIPRKSDIARLYREKINDQWTSLIEVVHEELWQKREYELPKSEADKQRLFDICKLALEFENFAMNEIERNASL